MYTLIETVGKRATIWYEEDEKAVETFIIQWYNETVKKKKRIDWQHTMIDLRERYAKVYDWIEERELRVAVA